MCWSWESFPVRLLAAWSLALDSVVFVQITERSIPKSLISGVWLPEETINGEDSDTTCLFTCYLSHFGFKANDFWGVHLGSPLLLDNWVTTSQSSEDIVSSHVGGAIFEENFFLVIFNWSCRPDEKWVSPWLELEGKISSEGFETNGDLLDINYLTKGFDHLYLAGIWFFIFVSPVWAINCSGASSEWIC